MDYAAARQNMVECQIRTNRVLDPDLRRALAETPREVFLPAEKRAFAYVDETLDLGDGRFCLEPLVLARLLKDAEIKPTDVVLNIGDATGYATAVIAKLAQTVVALECDPAWAGKAAQALSDLGVDNAAVVEGPLEQGYAAQAPYDVIVLSGAVNEAPPALCRQLVGGGRLVGVVNNGGSLGQGTLVVRVGDTWGRRTLFDAAIPALPGFKAKPQFVF